DPDKPRALAHRLADAREAAHVDRAERDAEPIEDACEEPVRAPVDVIGHGDVIAGTEQMRDRIARCHARAERETPATVLERREAGLERGARWIRGARVVVTLVLANGFLRVRRCLEDRHGDRASEALGLLSRVNGARVESGLAAAWHAVSMTASSYPDNARQMRCQKFASTERRSRPLTRTRNATGD